MSPPNGSSLSGFAAALAVLAVVSPGAVQHTQALAILLAPHEAMSEPNESSAALEVVRARRPITEERTVLPVLGHRSGPGGVEWLQVLLPGRPNGHNGWIKRRATRSTITGWHIVVDTSSRRVTIYQRGRKIRAFKAIVGHPRDTDTTG
jgi:hypothetical protein